MGSAMAPMPVREAALEGVRRLNINLPEATYANLYDLAEQSGRSMTDIVRIALGLVQVAIEEEKKGNKLAIASSKGELLKEIIILR